MCARIWSNRRSEPKIQPIEPHQPLKSPISENHPPKPASLSNRIIGKRFDTAWVKSDENAAGPARLDLGDKQT